MTSADLKFIPQSKAFAVDGEKNPSIPDTSTTAMNLATGFPSVYSKPLADGGKLIQRKEMNTLFYQLMLFQNFLQNGGYITWNNDVMMGIGGYPNGAVLSLIDSTTGAETRVQSCVDNNYLQPTSESIGEKYKVNTSTVPHTYTKDASGDVIWRYVSGGKYFDVARHESKVISTFTKRTGSQSYDIGTISQDCYFYMYCETSDPGGSGDNQGVYVILEKGGKKLTMPLFTEHDETHSDGCISINLVKDTKVSINCPRGKISAWVYAVEIYV